ncbi:MAG: MerC domain-containing protein [Planctomycetota bacterium]
MAGLTTTFDTHAADPLAAPPPAQAAPLNPGGWSDWLGVVASVGCAIHCAAMPFVIAYLPALGLSFLADEAFHKWMAVGCFGIAIAAFVPGLRSHKRWTPVLVASAGLVMISFAAFGLAGECCPACDATPGQSAAAPAGLCTDAGCTHCAAGDEARPVTLVTGGATANSAEPLGIEAGGPAPLLGQIAPWLTPVGGLILVSAHLLNRRYGCLCGCCSTAGDAGLADDGLADDGLADDGQTGGGTIDREAMQ